MFWHPSTSGGDFVEYPEERLSPKLIATFCIWIAVGCFCVSLTGVSMLLMSQFYGLITAMSGLLGAVAFAAYAYGEMGSY